MTRIVNDPVAFKEEMLEGFVAAFGRFVRRIPGASGVLAVDAPQAGRVSLLIGGGSGHYPAFGGFVGPGMASAAAIGNTFASPSAEQVYRVTKAADGGAGVLYCYGNYSGDVLNFDMAQERSRSAGIDVRTVTVSDDVASAPADDRASRRGIAGDLFVFKAAGASAARGDKLDEVERIASKANARTRSFGVAFAGCTLPGKSEPLFTVEPGRMELGLGVHGEPGVASSELLPASEIARLLVERLLGDAPEGVGADKVAVLVNGLGSTHYEEMFVLYRDIDRLLREAALEPHLPVVGELVTSLDMEGCSLSLMWLDDELLPLWEAPCSTPAFTQV
jgi:dihydroxyacetone kinase